MIQKGYEDFIINEANYTQIQYLALYMMILSILEFEAMMKFLIQGDMGGLIQKLQLKVMRYYQLFASRLRYNSVVPRLIYILLDLVVLESFLFFRDQAFSSVFHKYNRIIGADVHIRNAFIVSKKNNLGQKFLF
jgi:hypothetical protein